MEASVAVLAALEDGASGAVGAAAGAVVVVVVVVVVAVAVAAEAAAGTVMVGISVLTSTLHTRVLMAPGVVGVGTPVARDIAGVTARLASTPPANLVSKSWSAMFVFPFFNSCMHGAYSLLSQLPWSTANEDLIDLFETTGTVEIAEILFSGTRSMGSGVVQFASVEESETAIAKFQGYIYGGRPLGTHSPIVHISLFR